MVLKEGVEAVTATVTAMSSNPLAIALLLVNIGFLALTAFLLHDISANAAARNQSQQDLIVSLIRDCHGKPST